MIWILMVALFVAGIGIGAVGMWFMQQWFQRATMRAFTENEEMQQLMRSFAPAASTTTAWDGSGQHET